MKCHALFTIPSKREYHIVLSAAGEITVIKLRPEMTSFQEVMPGTVVLFAC